ncbi:hypothetical protein QJQ45_026057 [Haematococcus lacustris]|nr:hypothetical protein QJQ45_026057 [Haematococcus lacustris]
MFCQQVLSSLTHPLVQDKLHNSLHLHFNPMEQPGDDDDDELDEDVIEEDQFGRIRYLELCQELQISPVSQVQRYCSLLTQDDSAHTQTARSILKFLESEEMHITHYGLGLNGTVALVGALELNTSLTALRLPHNNIPDEGLRSLASCLVSNHNITELDLSGNRIGVQGAKALAELLDSRSCALRVLNCSHMHMSDREVVPLAAALENNQSLATLDLSNNDLGEKAGLALGNMLGINITLNELELSWNKLRTKGVAYIAEGLKPNLALQVLGLAWCGIQDAGAAALGGTFKINHGLVDVDFCGNGIGPEGAVALSAGIAQSTSLAAVALDNNDFREEGGRALLKALEMNRGIVICRVENTNISQELRIAADALLAPRMAAQRASQQLRLCGAQEWALEQFFKKLQEEMAEVAMKRHGRAKQLVVFFGAASMDTKGGWGANAVLRACCKVVLEPAVPGLMWSLVVAPHKPPQAPCSSQAAIQPAASEPGPSTPLPAKRSKRTKAEPEAAEPTKGKGKAAKAKPAPQPGRLVDRDCNAALNMQRIGESRWRPLELCWWPEQGKLPAKGKEYPGLGAAPPQTPYLLLGFCQLPPHCLLQVIPLLQHGHELAGPLQPLPLHTPTALQHPPQLLHMTAFSHQQCLQMGSGSLWQPWVVGATPAGTSLVAIQRHVAVTLATWDAVWEEYLHPKWAEQKMRLHGAQEKVLERYFKKLEEEGAAIESQKRWGTRKQLVVFFGNAGIGTRGGWGAKAVLQACRKVVERASSGKPTDRVPGKMVTVDEFHTSRVSSAMNSPQPCEEELDGSKPTRLEGWKPPAGQATPGDLGKWVDRDCNAALNLQRAGESKWRPLELCRWQHRARLPAKGKEYPALGFKKLQDRARKAQAQQPEYQQGYKLVNDRLPKARQRLHRAVEYARA